MAIRIAVDRRLRIPSAALSTLARQIERAGRALGWSREACGQIGVQIVDDAAMARLHERHLGERKATDVLSFPAEPGDPDEEPAPGDLVLNAEAIARQARGASLQAWLEEAGQLCVHGLVHLRGHDHGTRLEARRMLALERRVARAAGILPPARPYA